MKRMVGLLTAAALVGSVGVATAAPATTGQLDVVSKRSIKAIKDTRALGTQLSGVAGGLADLTQRVANLESQVVKLTSAPNAGPRGEDGPQGPQGVQGPQGARGPVGGFDGDALYLAYSDSISVAPGQYGYVNARCDTGDTVISGGAWSADARLIGFGPYFGNGTVNDKDAWGVQVRNDTGATVYISTTAVCSR